MHHPAPHPQIDASDIARMSHATAGSEPTSPHVSIARNEKLQHAIEHAAHLLPTQGPISIFVHHNTLHAFEDLPFEDGAVRAARILGCQPYWSEQRFHEELLKGRIRHADIEAVLREELGEEAEQTIAPLGTRLDVRLAMLLYPLRTGTTAELRWFVAETDALKRVRPDAPAGATQKLLDGTRRWIMEGAMQNRHVSDLTKERILASFLHTTGSPKVENWSPRTWEAFALHSLWQVCREGIRSAHPATHERKTGIRHRDLLLEATGEDSDVLVHSLLIRFCSAYLDQGLAGIALPHREEGFLRAFTNLYGETVGSLDHWLKGLDRELARLQKECIAPLESISDSLQHLGVDDDEWEQYLTATLLALRGWGGMLVQVEQRPDQVSHPVAANGLIEFLAVRLLLDRLALSHLAMQKLEYRGPLSGLRIAAQSAIHRRPSVSLDQRAFMLFQICQVLGCSAGALEPLSSDEWRRIWAKIEAFNGVQRRRVFHLAYERNFRIQTLDALAIRSRLPPIRPAHAAFQCIFCIDDREESFRRHLEEVAPDVETFSTAGFFGVAMYHRGVGEAHFAALCPAVVLPNHWVEEDIVTPYAQAHERRTQVRKTLGTASHRFYVHSRSFLGGALLTVGVGVLATIPLVARVLFPRLTGWLRRQSGHVFKPEAQTVLDLEAAEEPPENSDGRRFGFTVTEMAAVVEKILREIGLTSNFAPMVFVFGHGSSSLNNPHESAYNCGACGGSRGGPNARAFSQMANDPRVRAILAERGLTIPASVVFVGGLHNTCDDRITFFDIQRVPRFRREQFHKACEVLDRVRARNAHERCRLFQSAPLSLTPDEALRHVEERSEDLSQTRPEYNHSTNAICLVGRRWRFRGLFFDRRAFLSSYDPTRDDAESSILTRILLPVFPVCGGINLEYYFSTIDPAGYGCSTKLPHNITSLLGVMDGHASDLRTGLSWQMVEIHEPVRLLVVVETTPEVMLRIIERNEIISRFCHNEWVLLALIDPDSDRIHRYRNGGFEPYQPESSELPRVKQSVDWYEGSREHLGFAIVEDAMTMPAEKDAT